MHLNTKHLSAIKDAPRIPTLSDDPLIEYTNHYVWLDPEELKTDGQVFLLTHNDFPYGTVWIPGVIIGPTGQEHDTGSLTVSFGIRPTIDAISFDIPATKAEEQTHTQLFNFDHSTELAKGQDFCMRIIKPLPADSQTHILVHYEILMRHNDPSTMVRK